MNFSDKTFEALAPFERYYRTAIDGDWCSNPGRQALVTMHDALDAFTGKTTQLNTNCSTCQLTIVKRVGALYFEDKAAREQKANAAAVKAATKKKTTSKAKKS